jgi:branched-chain amino acid transport system permease protein
MPLNESEAALTGTKISLNTKNRCSAWRLLGVLLIIASALLLLVAPFYLDLYALRVMSMIFMFAALAQAINLIAGFTGYPAFGNVVFFGLGAYSTAVVMVKLGGSFILGLAAAVSVALVTAFVIGPLLLRLRGHYFAIATVGLNETIKAVVNNLTPLTGGGMGLSLPLPPWALVETARIFYYLLFASMTASILAAAWFKVSRLGNAARAIRDDEVKAEAMGLRTAAIKTAAWAVSAALTGFVGGVYAYWFSYVDPASVFDMLIAVKSFVIFLLGGAATVFGPVIAAFLMEYSSTVLWSQFLDYHLGAFGLGIMLIVLYMPDGIMQFLRVRIRLLSKLFGVGNRSSRPT